jgi:hypothetical protein
MIFEVTADQIELLGDADLRTLVGYLCEEEVRRQGHSTAAITWGGHQNAADGGIDVRVALPEDAAVSGYVPAPATGFQVKAEDMPRQQIIDEMAPRGTIRPSITDLASKGGAYVIVSSRGSVADGALQARKDAMRAALDGVASADALTVDFYDRRRIATWVNQHPGLIPWVREKVARPLIGWRPFGDWSSSPAPLDRPYLLDDAVRLLSPTIKDTDGLSTADGVNCLRRILRRPNGVIRLVGLSGVGKTRLVQALFDERLGNDALAAREAIYTDISDEPDPVPLELASQLIRLRRRAILIVDNCGIELHKKLALKAKETDSLLSLITIEYDITDDEPENTDVFKLEAASIELIEKMLEGRYPALAVPSRRVIAEFSHGNARIAFALAETAKKGESLANLRDSELFRRLFDQNKGPSEPLMNAAKVCALLYSFDGETLDGDASELARLATLAGTSAEQIYAHVAELQRRQLVQKRSKWRAILPHAIAHRLANLALQDIPFQRIEDVIVNGGSERMLRSFSKRIGYLHDNAHAAALAAKWFSPGGLLEPVGKYNELGKVLFMNIAPVDPAATLTFIEQAALKFPWFFGPENQNRVEITRTIRSIAYEPALFDRCVALLREFALQDQDRLDSAKNVLKSLFYLCLSGTHATGAQRATFIESLLDSDDEADRKLGITLLETMLQCTLFTSSYSFEFGARKRDYGSYPRRRQDFLDWFGGAIEAAKTVAVSGKPAAPAVRRILAANFAELCSRIRMVDEMVALAETVNGHSEWPEGWIGVRSAMRRCKGKIDQAQYERLEALAERMRPKNLADMVRSYALSKEWTALDIARLDVDDEVKMVEAQERVTELCVDLGKQLAKDRAALTELLPEIFSSESFKTQALGRGLATDSALLDECWRFLVEAFLSEPQDQRRANLLGGFIDAAMKRNAEEAEAFLDAALADPRMHPILLFLHAYAGITKRGFARLMSGLDLDTVLVSSYSYLSGGRVHGKIEDDDLRQLLLKLAAKEGGLHFAIEIIGMRIIGKQTDKLPVSEIEKAAARDLLAVVTLEHQSPHDNYVLGEVIRASLDTPACEPLARSLCTAAAEAIGSYRVSSWDLHSAIAALAKVFPVAVLDILVEEANDVAGTARQIFMDVRDNGQCPLQSIPDATKASWANEKPETRYIALAEVVRFSHANEDEKSAGWSSDALTIIEAAPDPAKALDVFFDRFMPMSWSGSRADILASRLVMIEALAQHAKPQIAEWAKARAPEFAQTVEKERAEEVRRDRNRDERFE